MIGLAAAIDFIIRLADRPGLCWPHAMTRKPMD